VFRKSLTLDVNSNSTVMYGSQKSTLDVYFW